MKKKQVFGVIVTTRSFFPSHLVADARKMIFSKLDKMGYGYVAVSEEDTNLGAVMTYDEAKVCANLFRKHQDEIEGILVILPNFGEELGVAEAVSLSGLNVPILVQAFDDGMDKLDMSHRRDAFCGKLSVCNNFYQRDIPFTATSKHTCNVDSEIYTNDLEKFAGVCRVVKTMRGARIASLGHRPVAFNTVRYSEKILQRHGISVQTVDMSEVIALAKKYEDAEKITLQEKEIKGYGTIPPSIDTEKVTRIAKLNLAMQETVEKLECDASAVQCWDSVENNYGCATCLGMSMMGNAGKPSACESDVMGAVTMLAMQSAAQSAPAYMDWNNNIADDPNACICLHCSNFPKSFFGDGVEIEIENLDVLGSTIGQDKCFGACKGQVASGPMTYAKISTDDNRGVLKMYLGEGDFTDTEIPTKGGVAACHVPNLQKLMHHIIENGYEHHVCFVRGHVADILEEAFSKYMGVEVYRNK